ncbi:MAG: 2-dehydropantoate 2-reductase [Burkholderiales bacterium]|nr:2-dehydropantoate 2-reductase [Burkholderiales bacterium]
MKVCIVGAGSIGGFVGVKLALAGEDVTLIARGANLEAIRAKGMRLVMHDGAELVARNVRATSSLAEAGPQDLVVLAMKAHQVAPVVPDLPHLLHATTAIIPMQNGIPWWYFQRLPAALGGGTYDDRVVETVDPGGAIMRAVDPRRIVGCVVYPAAELAAPGLVRHIEGDRFPLGELDGATTERVQRFAEMFARAGLKAPVLDNIRAEIWLKLWGNLTFNPISALSHSTLVDICQFPHTRQLAADMMTEAQTIANKLGVTFRVPLEKRIAGAEKVGKHKTSMLQDVEAGRDPEIDALVGSVIELGRMTGTPTPHIDTVYALVKLLARTIREERVYVRAHPFVG